jgi:hypothetical protein
MKIHIAHAESENRTEVAGVETQRQAGILPQLSNLNLNASLVTVLPSYKNGFRAFCCPIVLCTAEQGE